MDTRILTLFDDEDFLPQEDPKKKPKKETTAKEPVNNNIAPEPEAQHTDTTSDEINKPKEAQPVPALSIPENDQSLSELIDEPKNAVPEAADIEEELVLPEIEETGEVILQAGQSQEDEEDATDTKTAAADEELDKQILTELVQNDYASLIHRDYPFEVNHASVVEKKKNRLEEEHLPEEKDTDENDSEEVFEDLVPLPEWKLDKKYYSIGEVATLFAVNTSHIRFWTNEFKLKPRTTRKGDRLYSPKDIAELRLIHHLVKEKKHTIKGAKEKLKAGKDDVSNKLDLKDALLGLRDTLLQIKAQL
jgi:DNA-binding transcriptional MerR regulator